MWYTTRYEGFDDPKVCKKGPSGVATLQGIFSGLLQTGFLLQLIGLTTLFFVYYAYRGTEIFTYDLVFTSEEQRQLSGFRFWLQIGSGVQLLGSLYILFFHALLADDASWARGYRAGAKLLGNAAFFDVLSRTIQFIIYAYMNNHYGPIWWKQFSMGGAEWLVSALARLLYVFALFYYATSLFLLEIYHDNGTNDWHGLLNCFLFTVAGVSEIVALSIPRNAVSVIISWIALVSALVWSIAFEQEVNACTPLLNEPELTNEIEARVEKYARASPYMPVE
ncbi:uncharacterized protein LOC128883263 [Hylaeus volcanicus]|uniref:uncharacterized protein LOC128883263 n=1 Tax=Hylaeus volcanicus TaxID=313075 RepID=UPI0023B7D189|nr:uncharacterized protein LOC128883263 [Hylaeus volcanicus]